MHREVHSWLRFCRGFIEGIEGRTALSDFDVVEIGSRDVNGRASASFGKVRTWSGIDIAPGPGVDEVADGEAWLVQHKGEGFDIVVSCEVFEHARNWREIVKAAAGAVRQGGWFIMTCATDPRAPHSAVDGAGLKPGEWYGNVDTHDFLEACEDDWEIVAHEIDYVDAAPRSHLGDLFVLMRRV